MIGEMGFGVSLHGSNPEPLMSALDHQRTLKRLHRMSALPPIADIGTQPRNICFVPQADIRTGVGSPGSSMELIVGRATPSARLTPMCPSTESG